MAFTIQSTTERLESVTGIALAGEISRISGLHRCTGDDQSLSNSLVAMFGLLVQARSSFEEIDLYRNRDFFKTAFGLSYVPARETLRLHLEKATALKPLPHATHECNKRILKRATFSPVVVHSRSYMPVDVDVSVLDNSDSSKEGVPRTYMGVDGYAPIFSYIGAEGYMLAFQLRPGSQHCQKDTPLFLQRNLAIIEQLPIKHPVLFRMDGGNDAITTIKAVLGTGLFFLIKRNIRRERPEDWLELAQIYGKKEILRCTPGERPYIREPSPKATRRLMWTCRIST